VLRPAHLLPQGEIAACMYSEMASNQFLPFSLFQYSCDRPALSPSNPKEGKRKSNFHYLLIIHVNMKKSLMQLFSFGFSIWHDYGQIHL
jgi:hypothetical protein